MSDVRDALYYLSVYVMAVGIGYVTGRTVTR